MASFRLAPRLPPPATLEDAHHNCHYDLPLSTWIWVVATGRRRHLTSTLHMGKPDLAPASGYIMTSYEKYKQ